MKQIELLKVAWMKDNFTGCAFSLLAFPFSNQLVTRVAFDKGF